MGVPIYMSPQNLSKNYYTYKCDIWSMGIIIFEMLFEHPPWKCQDVESLFFQIMNHPKPYAETKEPHSEIFDVIFEKTLSYL
jgi:serine/threonine protein kinase